MPAQKRLINLEDFGLDYTRGAQKLKDAFPTPGSERTKFPDAWRYAQRIGLSADTFRELRYFTASMWQGTWMHEGQSFIDNLFLNTFNRVIIPPGSYLGNASHIFPRGGMEGPSSFVYAGQGGDQGQYALELKCDATGWINTGGEELFFDSPNSSGAGGNHSYNESIDVRNVRFIGPYRDSGFNPGTRKWNGVRFVRFGENSWVNKVRADFWDEAWIWYGGVPFTAGTMSAFWNRVAAASLRGCSLATINIATFSGDGNNRLVYADEGYGTPAGCILNIGLLKDEDGTTPAPSRPRIGNQIAMELHGQYFVNVGVVAFSNQDGANPEAMFNVKPTIPQFGPQGSVLKVGPILGFGYSTFLKNRLTGSVWPSPGPYNGVAFEHYAKGDMLLSGSPDLAKASAPGTPPPAGTPYPRTAWTAEAYKWASEVERPVHAIDNSAGRHYTNGENQKGNGTEKFILDMKVSQKVVRMRLQTRADRTTDYALGYTVRVSNDKVNWTTTPVTLSGTNDMMVTFTQGPSARYIEFAPNKSKPNWLSIDQLDVYGS